LLPCFAIVTCEARERLRREKQIIWLTELT